MNRKLNMYWISVGVLFLLAAGMRLYQLDIRPALEWDETIYLNASENTLITGVPMIRAEGTTENEIFLWHPPFEFYIRAAWMRVAGDSMSALRTLSVMFSLLTYFALFLLAREIFDGKTALAVLAFLVTDGWLVFTNRLNIIENAQMFWIAVAITAYVVAIKKKDSYGWFLAAGFVLGGAIVYKHTALHLFAIPVIMMIVQKGNRKKHLIVFMMAGITVTLYVLAMTLNYGEVYLFQTQVQMGRALGKVSSHGLNFDLGVTVRAIYNTYWVFAGTVGALLLSPFAFFYNVWKWRTGELSETNALIVAWYAAAAAFLGIIALKAPTYLILALIPSYLIVVSTAYQILKRFTHIELARTAITVAVTLVIVLNVETWRTRLFGYEPDNAITQTYAFFQKELEGKTQQVILTEQTLGVLLPQNAVWWDIQQRSENPDIVNTANYIVLYQTLTQPFPVSPLLTKALKRAVLLKEFQGFKEIIRVYRTVPSST